MSDYGDDELDWDDPNVLAELESLESSAAATVGRINPPPPPPPPRGAAVKAPPQPAVPRASQLPPPPKPAPAPVIPAGRPTTTTTTANPTSFSSRATTPAAAAAAALPRASQSQYGNARPGLILRPARPPQQRVAKPPAAPPPPQAALAAAVKQELSTSNSIPPAAAAAVAVNGNVEAAEEDEDENLPEIRINEQASSSSLYRAEPQRGTTIARPPPFPPPRAQTPVSVPPAAAAAPAPDKPEAEPRLGLGLAPAPVPVPVLPGRDSNTVAAAAAAGGSGLSAQERQELETLRREKAKMKEQLEAAAKKEKELEADVQRRAGENFIIRSRHSKAEAAHQQMLETERRDKKHLLEQIKAKERDYQRALSSMHTDKSFRQIEIESSGGRGGGGAASSAASRRTYHTRPHHPHPHPHPSSTAHGGPRSSSQPRGPSAAPESPTANRRAQPPPPPPPLATRQTRASTEQPTGGGMGGIVRAPPPAGPVFSKFQNSFAPAAAAAPPPSKTRGGGGGEQELGGAGPPEREGSMGPPPLTMMMPPPPPPPVDGKDKDKDKAATSTKRPAPATRPGPAAKRRKDGSDAATAGSPAARVSSPQKNGMNGLSKEAEVDPAAVEVDEGEREGEDDDDDASWSWEWVREDRDTRGDLLAAVFAHITLGAIDTTPAVVQNSHTGATGAPAQNSTGRMGATMRASTARSGHSATATARSSSRTAGRPRTQGRNSSVSAAAATPSSTSAGSSNIAKQPTIYALTNLRFPPMTAPALVSRYEDLSRDLFTLLGQRHHEVRTTSLASVAASKSTQAPSDAAQRVCEILGRQDPEAGPLAFHLATIFASMLHVLEAATLTGPMTALLKLISHLAFLSPLFAMACCGAEATNNNASPPARTNSTQKKSANGVVVASTALISLVGHIVARYCRPVAPDPDSLSATGRDALAGSAVVRTRRPRVTRSLGGRRTSSSSSSSTTNVNGGKKGGSLDALHRVDNLDSAKRVGLVAAALALLEGVAWRCLAVQTTTTTTTSSPLFTHVDMDVELATRLAEDAFADLLVTPYAIATLFDPLHSADLLLLSTRFLSMLACRKALFYKILGVKFYELEDVRTSRLAIFDRIASLLVAKRDDTDTAYNLDLALLSLSTILMMARDDAILLVAGSDSFVSELLSKIWQDVRVLWEWDGRSVLPASRERMRLNRRVYRLSQSVKLFYYMSLAPHTHSKLSIVDLLTGSAAIAPQISLDGTDGAGTGEVATGSSTRQRRNAYQRQAAHDLLTTSFGTLAFATMGATEGVKSVSSGLGGGGGGGGGGGKVVAASEEQVDDSSMPSWAEPGSKERRTLIELGYMAQEMLEDNSPDELDEIEVCFGGLDDLSSDNDGDGDVSDDDEEELEISEARPLENENENEKERDPMQIDAAS